MEWIHENPPHWDETKAKILGTSPEGVFRIGPYAPGDLISGEWWRVEDGGTVLGYGWMDTNWGDAEILLCVDPSRRREGVGAFVLEHLAREAAAHGLNYMYNVVPAAHPEPEVFARWLLKHGFVRADDDSYKRRVKPQP
jgi:GNAT superfamily N-acetyltransferase